MSLQRYTCAFCPGAWWVDAAAAWREPMWCPWCGRTGVLPEAGASTAAIADDALRHEYLSRCERWCAAHPAPEAWT